HHDETMSLLSNYVSSVAAVLLTNPAPEFDYCSNELALVTGRQIPVLRLMLAKLRDANNIPGQTVWSNRLQDAVFAAFRPVAAEPATSPLPVVFQACQDFAARYPEGGPIVNDAACRMLCTNYYREGDHLTAMEIASGHDFLEQLGDFGCKAANLTMATQHLARINYGEGPQAWQRFQKAWLRGDIHARYMMARLEADDVFHRAIDWDNVLEGFSSAATNHDIEACRDAALLLLDSKGLSRVQPSARKSKAVAFLREG